MQKAALYARYSTDEQRATSIDDQIRRAKAKAQALGYTVSDELIFTDAALTGQAKGLLKREGYARLNKSWENGDFHVLVVDELSRIARDALELAIVQNRIENTGIRFVTTDGIDSDAAGWQLHFGMASIIASQAIRDTQHRVIRGMQGQLVRGYMIAYPPFGYRLVRQGNEKSGGTIWEIVEEDAKWVRVIYTLRESGTSLGGIARHLNQSGVRTPRKPRREETLGYWRPATVRQLLRNAIYRGVFVWNGSAYSRTKAKKLGKALEQVEYPRPELRIVSDERWLICNQGKISRTARGGGKHLFAGLVNCGVCGATLSVGTGGTVLTLTCAQCGQAKRVGIEGRQGYYVSTSGIKAALIFVLQQILTDEAIFEFRQRLKSRLNAGEDGKILELRENIAKLERAAKRLLELVTDSEDEMLQVQYREVSAEKRWLKTKLDAFEKGRDTVDAVAIEKQLMVNPKDLLPHLFDGSIIAEKARAILSRLFPVIILIGKSSRFVALYRVHIAPGVLLAEASGTTVVDNGEVEMTLQVEGGCARPTLWKVMKV